MASTVSLLGDINPNKSIYINEPDNKYVVLGNLRSEYDVTMLVHSLIVFGEINISGKLVIETTGGKFYNFGVINSQSNPAPYSSIPTLEETKELAKLKKRFSHQTKS
jgi:hypothetical protein